MGMLPITTSTSDELFSSVNIDDLDRPWTFKIRGFYWFFCDFRLQRTLQECTATKWLEIDWQFAKRNWYRLSPVSWTLAQFFCYFSVKSTHGTDRSTDGLTRFVTRPSTTGDDDADDDLNNQCFKMFQTLQVSSLTWWRQWSRYLMWTTTGHSSVSSGQHTASLWMSVSPCYRGARSVFRVPWTRTPQSSACKDIDWWVPTSRMMSAPPCRSILSLNSGNSADNHSAAR